MSDYKLVPVEPTPEMVEAAQDAYMPFGDMELAIRMAILVAPDHFAGVSNMVEGEPVAWLIDWPEEPELGYYFSDDPSEHARSRPLYLAPQPAEQQTAPDVACSQSRESAMVVLEQGPDGTPAVWCDPEIADLVSALNKAGIRTVASCSGHGHRPGNIMLSDGRELAIARDFDEARKIDAMFPGINGEPPMVDVEAMVEYKVAAHQLIGIPASVGISEPIEGFAKRPQDIMPAVRDMALRIELLEHQAAERERLLAESRANDQQAMAYLNEVRAIVGGDDFPDMVRRCERLQAEREKLRNLLRHAQPIIRAYAEASHMLDGFRPRRNKWDELAEGIDAAMQEAADDN